MYYTFSNNPYQYSGQLFFLEYFTVIKNKTNTSKYKNKIVLPTHASTETEIND